MKNRFGFAAKVLVLGFLLGGCGGGDKKDDAGTSSASPDPQTSQPISTSAAPASQDLRTPTKLFLVKNIDGRQQKASIGDTVEHVLELFPQPPSAALNNDLPQELAGSGYRARGWDNPSARPGEAFGVISLNERAALMMRQLTRTTDDGLNTQIAIAEEAFGKSTLPPISEGPVSYWFWEDNKQRYMICAIRKGKTLDLTLALGTWGLMDQLGMSHAAAQLDAKRAATEFRSAEDSLKSARR